MHQRKLGRRLAAALVVLAGVTIGVIAPAGTPAGAQETPALGFTIDATGGSPGSTVNGQVDVDDVAQLCVTDVEAFRAEIAGFGAALDQIAAEDGLITPETTQLDTFEQAAAGLLSLAASGIQLFDDTAADALSQTFVMTFADIATQQPVGQRANFDPAVGQASVTVPDVAPGPWAVAGTCVGPSTDPTVIRAAISSGASFLESSTDVTLPIPLDDFDFLIALATEHAPALFVPVMEPQALGVQIFCVFDASGACPGQGPGGPGGPGGPTAPPAAPPAAPVAGQPSFTG